MSRSAKPPAPMPRGQILSIGGPGAMLDLPDQSVIVGGLDSWGRRGTRTDPRVAPGRRGRTCVRRGRREALRATGSPRGIVRGT